MKLKLLAFSCCLAAAFTAQAQIIGETPSENKTYKPTAGDITTEVAVNLQHGAFLNGGQLRVRKFKAEDKALRLGASLDYSNDKSDAEAYASSFGLSLAPGIEKHFGGTNRLSPYIGAALPIGIRSSKQETENYSVKGATSNLRTGDHRSNFNIGLNGLAGVDYYFAPRFYTGFEVGIGLKYTNYNDIETTFKNDIRAPEKTEGYYNINFSPFSTGGIRLGFVF